MSRNIFPVMFECYYWKVESFGNNNFIAYNKDYCIPFTYDEDSKTISGATFKTSDYKDLFLKKWDSHQIIADVPMSIGEYALSLVDSNEIANEGDICGTRYDCFKVGAWLSVIPKYTPEDKMPKKRGGRKHSV